MNTWIRGRSAPFMASQALSTSEGTQRASEAILGPRTCADISLTASKSPGEAAAKPAPEVEEKPEPEPVPDPGTCKAIAIGLDAFWKGVLDGEWRSFGGDPGNTKYSPLDQINRDNFQDLEVAFRWESISTKVAKSNPRIRPGQPNSILRGRAANPR